MESQILFVVVCWLIWKDRNNFVFNNLLGSVENTVRAVDCFAAHIIESYKVKNSSLLF